MNTPTTRTPELDAYVRELRADGWTMRQIAIEIGCCETTVSAWLRSKPMTEPMQQLRTVEMDTRVRRMSARGMTAGEIRVALGDGAPAPNTISHWLGQPPLDPDWTVYEPRPGVMPWPVRDAPGQYVSLPAVRCLMGDAR